MSANNESTSAAQKDHATGVLVQEPIAYLSLSGEEPYVVPINFVYDGATDIEGRARVFFHSGRGKKTRAIERDPRVCLLVVAHTRFEQGPEPCADGFSFRSLIAYGQAALVTDPGERDHALRMIVAKYDPAAEDAPFDEKVLGRTLVYSLPIDRIEYKERRPRS